MRFPSSFVLLLLTAVPAAALPQTATAPPPTPAVTSPTHIEVKATGTPLPEVLERIARQTGMKVTYEGGTPRTRITTSLASVTPAQAVVSVMEGLGLNYLMGLDSTSTRVETLLVVSPGSGSKPTVAAVRGSSAMPRMPDEMPEETEPTEEDPMAGAIMEAPPVDPTDPMGLGQGAQNPAVNPQDVRPVPNQQPITTQGPVGIGWSAPPPGFSNPPAPPQPIPVATPPPPNQ
jgi:hypothetical protein